MARSRTARRRAAAGALLAVASAAVSGLLARSVAAGDTPSSPAPSSPAPSSPAPSGAAATATPVRAREPRLITTESLTLRARDVDRAVAALLARAVAAGWRLEERADSRVVLRLPPDALPAARAALRELGVESGHQSRTRDVSGELADLEARQRAAEAALARLLALQGPHRSVDEVVALTRAADQVLDELTTATRERQQLERAVAEATLEVTFVPAGPPAAEAIPTVRLPFPWLERTHEDALRDLDEPSEPPEPGEPGEPGPRRRSIESFPELSMLLEYWRLRDRPHPDENAWALGGALRARALAGTKPVGFAMGFDVGLAGGEGFAHDLDLLAGVAAAVNSWLAFGLMSGPAGRAWTGGASPPPGRSRSSW